MTTTKTTAMMRIRMAVMMKMASVGKCNKGPMLGKRRKNNSLTKTTFSRTLRTKLLPQDVLPVLTRINKTLRTKHKNLKKAEDNILHQAADKISHQVSKLWCVSISRFSILRGDLRYGSNL